MELKKQGEGEPLLKDVPANQEFTEIDKRLLDSTNLINRLTDDLRKETDLTRAAAIKKVLDKEIENKKKILDEKFIVAKPQEPAPTQQDYDNAFDAAVGRENGGALDKMDRRGGI